MKNFFNDPEFQAELQRDATQARDHLANMKPIGKLTAGDSFFFVESNDLPVRWVCVLPHVDNSSLWFLVAADEYPKIGTCDIELPEPHPWAPLALRCSVGFWAHFDDLNVKEYVGRLEGESIADARHRLSEMVVGQVPITEHGLIAEAGDDYRDWIAELAAIAEQIEARLQAEPVVLAKVEFNSSWSHLALVAERPAEYFSLAADTIGTQEPVQVPFSVKLPSKLSGVLLLQRDGEKFDLVYYPANGNDHPPRVVFATCVDARSGEWNRGVDGVWTWSQSLAATDDRVEITIGAEKFSIPIS